MESDSDYESSGNESFNSKNAETSSLPSNQHYLQFPCQANKKILLAISIADELEEIIKQNENQNKKSKKDLFYSNIIPNISIADYLIRIIKFTNIEYSTLINSIINLYSFLQSTQNYLTSKNIFRLLITSCYINSKFYQDINYSIAFYARVGGLPYDELSDLEFEFYLGNNYNLFIDENTFNRYINYYETLINNRNSFPCNL